MVQVKVFLIVVAVIVAIFALIFSLSATITVIYDNKWTTKVKVLWIEKDIELSKILSFILFPAESADKVKKNKKEKKSKESNRQPTAEKVEKSANEIKPDNAVKKENSQSVITVTDCETGEKMEIELKDNPNITPKQDETENQVSQNQKPQKEKKPNFIKNIWDKDGIVGIMLFVTNLLETASSAINALFRGFHIYSLYVKIIIGGGDAADVANAYGRLCKYYYPLKGVILNGMRVDNYDDLIMPDFIAPQNEYGLQFIGSLSVGAIVKMLLKAGKVFVVNIIKDK